MNENRDIQLLIIDPQNDFCDIPEAELPAVSAGGVRASAPASMHTALPVPGANDDMKRLAGVIARLGEQFNAVHVTLDSHNPVDIAHPAWWSNARGDSPDPFTVINGADLESGVWMSRDPAQRTVSASYVRALEQNGRYSLVIWPEHCLIGSWGHNVHAQLKSALDNWARSNLKLVNFVAKGINPRTEHYSAIRAEVPDAADLKTQTNKTLVDKLRRADMIVIAGEALSHCVASTVRDLADEIGEDNIRKLLLLTDCASPVGGFERQGALFLEELAARGMRMATSETLSL